jgi:hypothetical protein
MRRTVLSVLAIVGTMAVNVAPSRADTLPATAGRAWLASEAACFWTPSFSNKVSNGACFGNKSWLIPLTLRWTGQTWFRASSLQTQPPNIPTSPSPTCRYVLRTPADAEVSLGTATPVGGLNVLLGSPSVSSNTTTGHIDCTFPQGAVPLTQVKWLNSSS